MKPKPRTSFKNWIRHAGRSHRAEYRCFLGLDFSRAGEPFAKLAGNRNFKTAGGWERTTGNRSQWTLYDSPEFCLPCPSAKLRSQTCGGRKLGWRGFICKMGIMSSRTDEKKKGSVRSWSFCLGKAVGVQILSFGSHWIIGISLWQKGRGLFFFFLMAGAEAFKKI